MIDLLSECYDNHISVVERELEDFNGAFINYKSTNIIALNSNLDSNKKNCVLCEELGHFYKQYDKTVAALNNEVALDRDLNDEFEADEYSMSIAFFYKSI